MPATHQPDAAQAQESGAGQDQAAAPEGAKLVPAARERHR